MGNDPVLIVDFDGVNSVHVSDAFNRIEVANTVVAHDSLSESDVFDSTPVAIVLSPTNLGTSYQLNPALLCVDTPVLGICNGAQLIVSTLGGTVTPGTALEAGLVELTRRGYSLLATGTPRRQYVYMNHEHYITSLPKRGRAIARTELTQIAAFEIIRCPPLFGLQFHPESAGSRYGPQMLRQFVRCARAYRFKGGDGRYSPRSTPGAAR